MNRKLDILIKWFNKHLTKILWIVCLVTFSLSFLHPAMESPESETIAVEKKLNFRLGIMDEFARRALDAPSGQWLDLNGFPDDMVLYKYVSDTLQSWVNLFPIHNDIFSTPPPWYKFHDLSNRNPFNTPLAHIDKVPKYVNLGNSWYILKSYEQGESSVIAGILVKNEYLTENAILHGSVNQKLGLDEQYTTTQIQFNDHNIVATNDGEPLFSIVRKEHFSYTPPYGSFRWLAVLFAGFALFSYHYKKRTMKSLILIFISLVLLRFVAFIFSKIVFLHTELFSPTLYADGEFFNSLGVLMINHLFVFLDLLAFFMMRMAIIKDIRHSSKWSKRIKTAIVMIVPVLIMLYIHFTLRSLIINSSINLEPYNIEGISIYTILVFLSYALIFTSLLLSLQFVVLTLGLNHKLSILSNKGILIYLIFASIYSVFSVAYFGFNKEFESNRATTNKLAVDRDLELELQLRTIEGFIQNDQLIKFLVRLPNGGELIKNRLEELYFWNIINEYDIRITVCRPKDLLKIDNYSQPVDCFTFFKRDIVDKYGIPLGHPSHFFSLNNNNNFINYFGQFSFVNEDDISNMYIEIDSKKVNEDYGYPSFMINQRASIQKDLPSIYSFAKYYDNKLVAYDGTYNYPLVDDTNREERYTYIRKNGYVHFINKISSNSIIILTREQRSIVPYTVTFSYIYIFYASILFILFNIKQRRRKIHKNLPKYSFRKKITYLITTTLIVAIGCVTAGSIVYIIQSYDTNNRNMMEDKLSSIQTSISEMCKYASGGQDIRSAEITGKIKDLALNTQVDINLFNTKGKLISSTKEEVFDQYFVSTRMNPRAYKAIILNNEKQVIEREKVTTLDYYSLYAPIFNIYGNFIAILNIPYFIDNTDAMKDATPIVATVINLFLLLVLAAVVVSRVIANSIAKPVLMISKKMQELDISQKGEHIDYSVNDELGALVTAYNNMVDDLDESTRRLAEGEREQAWKEMARHIAHEIKNPLTPMQLSIQHLIRLKQQNVPNWDEKFYSTAASLLEQINILSQTASEFSSFAKFYNEDNKVFDLITTIQDQLSFFDTKENISIQFETTLTNANVLAKRDQIIRVLVNLISNAIQALEDIDGGRLMVSLKKDDRLYYVTIEDNGPGVSQENLSKLFKPNFTTKSSGTGLGLAICKSIIDQSNGSISYRESELGGANFTFTLPIYQQG